MIERERLQLEWALGDVLTRIALQQGRDAAVDAMASVTRTTQIEGCSSCWERISERVRIASAEGKESR